MTHSKGHTPLTDVYASDDAWLVKMDLPGVSQDALDVQVEADQLTVTSTDNNNSPPRWFRRMTLPRDADRDSIRAELKDGVLSVEIPRSSPAVRRIAIG